MASRKPTRMSRITNIEPMPLTLTFQTASGAAGTPVVSYVDLSQASSLAGRKFLRQGLNYAVAGIKCISNSPGTISVYKLPNTWVMANAWKKSFATWTQMNNKALEEAESVRPRFLDFKIYADAEHHSLGFGANLLPRSTVSFVPPLQGVTTAGEWESAKIMVPKAVDLTLPVPSDTMMEYEVIATGANYPGLGASGLNAVSAIEGYASSRGLPNVRDPNAPDDVLDAVGEFPENWMTAVFNEGTTQDGDLLEVLITENNIAPYPFENDGVNLDTMYPAGANQMQGLEWHDLAQIFSTSATTNVGIARIKGGSFACGLLKVVWLPTAETANMQFQIDLIPGSHRGLLAEPMQDM